MTTLLVILLIFAFISGAPLFAVMVGGAALGAYTSDRSFGEEFSGMVETAHGMGTGDQAQVLSTIPLFIYAGYLLAEARTADRLVRFANAALGWFPGGLAIVTIMTCALFTVFTGASGVTIVALGGLLLPALVKQGYPERFSLGLIAGTGSVGLLFPPALPLFIYGTVYGLTKLEYHGEKWDTGRFLFAGIVPGILLVSMLSAVAVTVAIVKKLPRQKFNVSELGKSFLGSLPELIIPFAVIAGLALGVALPSVAALTVFYVVILESAVLRQIKLKVLWTTSYEAMSMVGAIFIIIFTSTIFTNYLVTQKVPDTLIQWTQDNVDSKIVFLLAINGILLLVGTVMDIFSAIVIVLPLIAPIANAYDINPYHLGVIFLLNLEVGYLHPPVGLNLFITSVKFRKPITEVMWATVPFLITMLLALFVVTYVPALTVVPDAPRTDPLANLVTIVAEGASEAGSVKEIQLALIDGTVVKDAQGKPIVKRLKDCASLEGATEQGKCTSLFLDVTQCRATNDAACEKAAIAKWTIANVEVITVEQVTLVDQAGANLPGADGQPVVRNLADCKNEKNPSDVSSCRELFKGVSDCRNAPPEEGKSVTECEHRAVAVWVTGNRDLLPTLPLAVTEVALVNGDGEPVKQGGKQIVKKLPECEKVADETAKTACRELFVKTSDCKVAWEDATPEDCTASAISDWVTENMP
ncbi:MAG: TRAP transporter large permease [Deltaproteobacteria bacterium]|nr:TRAP transporter large permease [Deltaproteobacteria bacterium]